MLLRRSLAALGMTLLLLAPAAHAAKCPEFSGGPQPEWITRNTAPAGYYTGVGQAQKGALSITDQMNLAKQAALRDLAGGIRVAVRSELNLRETATGAAGKMQSRTEAESLTQTRVEAELADVEADETWMDAKACVIWVRVKVSAAAV